jgi:Zn-finger nucleic acid-binding protein
MVPSSSLSYTFCQHCGSFFFPERKDDGVRVLGEASESHACPECRGGLSLATLDDRHRVNYCTRCGGVLLPRSVFVTVVQSRRAWAKTPVVGPLPLDPRELEREVHCPSCKKPMHTHPYLGPGNIVIDTCDACDVVWLGPGELVRAVDAPGRDRGSAYRSGEGSSDLGMQVVTSRHQPDQGRGKYDLLDILEDLLG